jgi:xanthine/CO dehydrogenase XdhC/CoxF family maturation factor
VSTLYLDESKAKNYVFIGILVQAGDAPRLRKRVAALKMPGQRSIHFVNESESRRKKLLQEYSDLGIIAVKVVSTRKSKLDAREDCVRSLVHLAASMGCNSMVFDRDESVISKDELWLKSELRKVNRREPIGFQHLSRHEEPILWVADALAWCDSRGGDWRKRIQSFIFSEREIDA